MKVLSSISLIIASLLCFAGISNAASQVILWNNNSTNYSNVFGSPAPTNEVTNIVAVTPASSSYGLRNDGAVMANGFYGVTMRPGLSNVVALASSAWNGDGVYSLALKSDSTVVGWGSGPINPPATLSNVVAISAGTSHAIALRKDGTITGWGYNIGGVLDVPAGLSNVVAISAGANHNLALKNDGTVVGWGQNAYGQANIPVGLSNVVAIAGAYDHSLTIKADGKMVAWGKNSSGYSYSNLVAGISNVAVIAAGWSDVAVRVDGTILSWGNDYFHYYPIPLATPVVATNVVSLSCGRYNMAILGDGLPRTPANPMTLTVPYGLPLVLPATPGGTRALNCQWSLNGTNLLNATNMAFTLVSVDFPNAGIYSATVSNWYGAVTNSYTINVVPFFITTPPQNQSVYGGATATFSVTVSGVVSYQWQFNGTSIAGATNATLTLTNVRPEQAGSYTVVVSNPFAILVTPPVALSVGGALQIYSQPSDQSALSGTTVNFSVGAEGVSPIYYQWRFDGRDLPGQTNSVLTLANVWLDQIGTYSVVVSNSYLTLASSNAQLGVFTLSITGQPQNQSTFRGGTATFSVAAAGASPIHYQWQLNGTNLVGATNNMFTLPNLQFSDSGGVYRVAVGNAYENLVSDGATLFVGLVAAWGENFWGEAFAPYGLTNVIAIASGAQHSLALRDDETVVGWGLNSDGEATAPTDLTDAIAIAGGGDNSLALRRDGTVRAWGWNHNGQANVPVGLSNVVALAGANFSLALKADGTIIPWATGVPSDLTDIVAISVGTGHSLALKSDGAVAAWGFNGYGQTSVPSGLKNVVAISAGNYFSLALKSDGSVVGWGDNGDGQLDVPADLTNAVAIAAGWGHSLALLANGTVIAWGGGQIVPPSLTNVVAIAAGYYHSLALLGDGPPVLQAFVSTLDATSNGFSASIPSRSGKVYRLEYVSSVESTNWIPLPLVAGNGAILTLSDPTATNSSHRFYRVRRW